MCSGKSCDICDSSQSKQESESKGKDFSAKEFVDNLIAKGTCLACDETSNAYNNQGLPSYYDEEMFKKGQRFFYKNIFGLFFSKFLGLLSCLALKDALPILILTKMSSSNMTAYRRYVSTILHMVIWYDSDFKPNSRLWQSIQIVKTKHKLASKRAKNAFNVGINQKDMALTQFGFMGYAICRSELIGLHNASKEELESFIHVWRVIGHVLGIEEEFNICKESVEETKQICDELITRIFKPAFQEKTKDQLEMSSYLINGLWACNPFLDFNVFMFYLNVVLEKNMCLISNDNLEYDRLLKGEKLKMQILVLTLSLLRFSVVKFLLKCLQIHSLYMTKTFPYLAYIKYGLKKSNVSVLQGVS